MSQSTIPDSVYNMSYTISGLASFRFLINDLNTNIDNKFLIFTENTKSCEMENVLNDGVTFSKDFKRYYSGQVNN